jgi:hypothetical protein
MSTWTGAVSTDWNNALNWGAGGIGIGVPSPTVDAIFDASSSLPCTTGATTRSCRNLITTGYAGTLTIGTTPTANLNVVGTTITFGTNPNHLDPTGSQGLISINTNGTTITSASSSVIVPGITNSGSSNTFNLVGTISVKRFAPAGSALFIAAAASTFIDIVTGGSVQGGGGVGTNVTLRINGSCTVNAAGFVTRGNFVLNSSSTLTMNGPLTFSNTTTATTLFDCSAGILIPGTQLFTISLGSVGIMSINLGTNSLYDLSYSGFSNVLTLLSNINITRNLTVSGNPRISGAFNITVGGNLTGGSLIAVTTGQKLILTGAGSGGTVTVTSFSFGATGTNNYTLEINCLSNNVIFTGLSGTQGDVTASAIVNYLATNTGTLTTTSHIWSYGLAILTINMNGVAGPTKSWGVIRNSGGVARAMALLSNVFCQTLGDATQTTGTSNGDIFLSSGGPYYLGILGNAEKINNISSTSTAELRFVGSTSATFTTANPANTMAIDIRTDKTGVANVTFPAVFNWGAANKILNLNSTANFSTNSTTLTLAGTPLTILNASNSQFWNLTTAAGTQTININTTPLVILNNLTITGTNTTFAGTAGWTCGNLLCSVSNAFITLQSLITYTTTTSVNMLGSNAQRILMRSSDLSAPYDLAIWTFNGNTQSMIYVNATAIDSDFGQTIWSFIGTPPTGIDPSTRNWNPGTKPETQGITFVN